MAGCTTECDSDVKYKSYFIKIEFHFNSQFLNNVGYNNRETSY